MKILSMFNNKGGVGKTTLTYHLAHILVEMGKKVLILDLDSQCNMSLYGMQEEELAKVWKDEEYIIDHGIDDAKRNMSEHTFTNLFKTTRTMHFLLKSVEEGISDFDELPPPFKIIDHLDLIPSRLTLFMYENKIAERWNGMFLGEPLSIRTVTRIRELAEHYSAKNHYDFVIIDTSPNLGLLNKVIISTVDGFMIPCLPDIFSLYGIKDIGKAISQWQREFNVCFSIISAEKRKEFPREPVRFLGYTLCNAKKDIRKPEQWYLPLAHYNYAQQIPDTIHQYIAEEVKKHLSEDMIKTPIGNNAVLHTHRTLTNIVQKYKKPLWALPNYAGLEPDDKNAISGNHQIYKDTKEKYVKFAKDFLKRIETLDDQ